jgi:hypothetical protein
MVRNFLIYTEQNLIDCFVSVSCVLLATIEAVKSPINEKKADIDDLNDVSRVS